MDNKQVIFVVIYEWINDTDGVEVNVYDTEAKAKAEYDRRIKDIPDLEDFNTHSEVKHDFIEDGDNRHLSYYAYNEGRFFDEHYHVELIPQYIQ